MGGRLDGIWAKVALLWLLMSISLALQSWVGDATIYSQANEAPRAALHQAILDNQPPGGKTWAEWGALSVQKRVGVVYLAEGVRKATGLRIGAVYKLIDTAFLMLALVALFAYLRRWVPTTMALMGTLYFSALLPLTYFFQLFHPWDRLQLFLWIVLLGLIADRRFALLAIGLVVSVLVKFDTVLLPALYFAAHLRRDGRARLVAESLVLGLLAVGTSLVLSAMFGDPAEASRFELTGVFTQLGVNWHKLMAMKLSYPPLLVHALPLVLALAGWRQIRHRFVGLSVLFGASLGLIHLLLTNFEEVRAHMMILVLLLPAALLTAGRLLEREAAGPVHETVR